MLARIVRKISFWIGIAAVGAMPLVPVVCNWLYPPRAVKLEQDVVGLASFAVDVLGVMGDGILVMVWMSALAATAVLASLIAFIAAWTTREPRQTKILCWVPALLASAGFGVLAAIDAGIAVN